MIAGGIVFIVLCVVACAYGAAMDVRAAGRRVARRAVFRAAPTCALERRKGTSTKTPPRPRALRAAGGAGARESGAIPRRCPVVDRPVCYYDGSRHWQGILHPPGRHPASRAEGGEHEHGAELDGPAPRPELHFAAGGLAHRPPATRLPRHWPRPVEGSGDGHAP